MPAAVIGTFWPPLAPRPSGRPHRRAMNLAACRIWVLPVYWQRVLDGAFSLVGGAFHVFSIHGEFLRHDWMRNNARDRVVVP